MYALRFPLLAFLLMTAAAAAATGLRQTQPADPGTRDICAAVSHVELPPADRPTSAELNVLKGCVSLDLYFGFGVAPDPVRARKCAYVEMEAGDREPVIGGRTMLMMIYANGKGASRDFDVALKLACMIGGAPQDIAGRVGHLARLRAGRWTGDTFSICDHSSGRPLYEQCAILQERFDKEAREKRLSALKEKWGDSDRKAFDPLREAADRFFRAHAGKEANLEATVEVQERAFLEDEFIASLERFERGDRPRFSADGLSQAETAMNAAYASTQQGKTHAWGTATSDGIRETQQVWVVYRDAWVRFAKTKCPAVGADSWKTWLTRDRAAMLDRFPQ